MIVIDAGHGGSDPGAINNAITEKDYNLRISEYMKRRFDDLKIPAVLVRSSDETLNPTERIARIKSFSPDSIDTVIVSNHLNAGGGTGAEVIYALRDNDNLARKVTNELARAGSPVRDYYQRRLPSDPSKDYYFIHRDTGKREPIIVEYGFVDNAVDYQNIIKNWSKFVESVVKAVSEYKGYKYTAAITNGEQLYTVKVGDSLYSIARDHNTTVNELKALNGLSSNLLQIGQTLKLPNMTSQSSPTSDTYQVVTGDSLYSIAKKFNTTVSMLKSINTLTSDILSVGQILKIKSEQPIMNERIHIVKAGESLYQIALLYNTTVIAIKNLNNLTNNYLSIGQQLKIPTISNVITHQVEPGDTLYSIATKYNTTPNKIKSDNNLTSDLLSINQQLQIF